VRIIVADGLSKVRFAVQVLLARQPGLQVVGEAGDADSLLAQALDLAPDVVLLDRRLRGMATEELVQALRRATTGVRVIILGDRPEMRQAAFEAGGDAFVAKVDPPERLLAAIKTVVCETGCQRAGVETIAQGTSAGTAGGGKGGQS
jgi:DNA-binding NarL/FixJ family response regulator